MPDELRPEVEIVRAGYDAMAERYRAWSDATPDPDRTRLVAELDDRLRDGSTILDLGCGDGLPSTRHLARRHHVRGVDVSAEQVTRARRNVPNAGFEQSDVLELNVAAESVDAVVALYSLTHLPRELHAGLFEQIRGWLRPGGLLLATLSAHGASDGVQDDFLGVPMFFSGYPADQNRELVRAVGFRILIDEVVTLHEPTGDAGFLWILATKPPTR
jgi:cyclopropane fatty-acyl-phospholipid synthase-like methyltransferase